MPHIAYSVSNNKEKTSGKQMRVPKIVVPPKSPSLIGFSIINHPFWGTPIFGNTQLYLAQRTSPATARATFWRHHHCPGLNICGFATGRGAKKNDVDSFHNS